MTKRKKFVNTIWTNSNIIVIVVVPLPKSKDYVSKPLSCEDFRGIAISPVIAKAFEYCFLQKFGDYLYTDSKQFGFKKGMGCNRAISTVRCVITHLTVLIARLIINYRWEYS